MTGCAGLSFQRVGRGFSWLALALAIASGHPTRADDVYLENGAVYEGVVARVEGSSVKIRISHRGQITLPREQVLRIEAARSLLERWADRRDAVDSLAAPGVEDWLQLAFWARESNYRAGVKEAALAAAILDPLDSRLPDLLRPLGFRLDQDLEEWVTEAEHHSRRGAVQFEGQWLSPEDVRLRLEARRLEVEREIAEREERLATLKAQEELRAREQYRVQEDTRAASVVVVNQRPAQFTVPYFYRPAGPASPAPEAESEPTTAERHRQDTRGYAKLIGRQPGTFIPLD